MCGRFTLTAGPKEVENFFETYDFAPFPPRYNIPPTEPILTIVSAGQRPPGSNLPARQSVLVRWGLIPAWAKNPKELPLLINARAETAAEKPAFKAAMRHRRALIPASGFYEWKRQGAARAQPYFVRPKGGGLVAFAGLIETYAEANGSEIDTGAILTTAANAEFAAIHARMPAVIEPRDFHRWLDCRTQEPRDVADLLRPVSQGFFEAIPVSDRVNSVANAGPDVQERIDFVEAPDAPAARADRQLSLF